ncbi:MAG: MFS transporter [Pseudomonadota bacterium]
MSSQQGAWYPLRNRTFRALWIAMLISNIGTWMHDIGAGWHMTSLSASPLMVALVQTATTLPMFALALVAGALADSFDRRRYLIVTQCWLLVVAATLGVLTLSNLTSATVLLAMTLLMGIGSAMMMPAWSAVTPNVVPRDALREAIALNSLSINLARAIGPAIAGLIVVRLGSGAVFLINACTFVAVLVALYRWQYEPRRVRIERQAILPAIGEGLRYVRRAPAFQSVMLRGVSFYLFASALWALLPLVARGLPDGDATTFGLLVAGMGVGAVTGGVSLSGIRRRVSSDRLILCASVLFAAGVASLSIAVSLPIAFVAVCACGFAWISVLSTVHTAVQLTLDDDVRSRALSVYMMSFMGSMAIGSATWGKVASVYGVPTALAAAGVTLALFAWPAMRFSLVPAETTVVEL